MKAWAWRLGGHHLSLHFAYAEGKLSSWTPTFFGAEQVLSPNDPREVGYKMLAVKQELSQSLINSLNPEQLRRATIAPQFSGTLIISEARKLRLERPAGLPASEMSEEQRTLLLKMIR